MRHGDQRGTLHDGANTGTTTSAPTTTIVHVQVRVVAILNERYSCSVRSADPYLVKFFGRLRGSGGTNYSTCRQCRVLDHSTTIVRCEHKKISCLQWNIMKKGSRWIKRRGGGERRRRRRGRPALLRCSRMPTLNDCFAGSLRARHRNNSIKVIAQKIFAHLLNIFHSNGLSTMLTLVTNIHNRLHAILNLFQSFLLSLGQLPWQCVAVKVIFVHLNVASSGCAKQRLQGLVHRSHAPCSFFLLFLFLPLPLAFLLLCRSI